MAGAIELCHRAGVGVKMITGDHPGTARAIARELGIEGEVVTDRDLDAMSVRELAARIPSIGGCARVSPEHKVRIVEALQANGEVVAMTGDGVNDAAALRRADDDFRTIVTAVERGRTIFDNILTFVLLQLVNVLAVRGGPDGILGRHQLTNRWVWAAVALVLAVQVAVVQVGALRTLFDTTALTAAEWATAAGAALSLAIAREVITRLGRRAAAASAGRGRGSSG